MPLDIFAKVLKERVKKINSNAIVAQRLKRTPSILLKLRKHKTMRLSTMQDIGGLRAIVDNAEEVYELAEVYTRAKSRHKIFSDVIKNAAFVYEGERDEVKFFELIKDALNAHQLEK